MDNIEKYKVSKKTAKRVVSVAKGRAYEDLYQRLSTKEGEKDIYRMARARDRKTRDLNQVKCIKDEREQLLVKEDEIRQRWQEYFDKLFNGENENFTVSFSSCNFGNAAHEEGEVSLEGQVMSKKDTFRYLGTMLQKDGDIDADV